MKPRKAKIESGVTRLMIVVKLVKLVKLVDFARLRTNRMGITKRKRRINSGTSIKSDGVRRKKRNANQTEFFVPEWMRVFFEVASRQTSIKSGS